MENTIKPNLIYFFIFLLIFISYLFYFESNSYASKMSLLNSIIYLIIYFTDLFMKIGNHINNTVIQMSKKLDEKNKNQ